MLIYAFADDELADVEDTKEICRLIGKACKHYEEIAGSHLTPMIGKDVSYFAKALETIKIYHPEVQVVDYDDSNIE